MIIGQLTFGLFGDALGRHKVYGKELILTILGTLLLIVAPPYLGHSGIVAWMAVFRVITGMGIGGGKLLRPPRTVSNPSIHIIILVGKMSLLHNHVIPSIDSFKLTNTYPDYPMTSSISAEHNPMGSRAKLVLTVFASIGLGGFSAGVVYVILLAAFKESITVSIHHLQWVWRLLFGIGLVPLILTLYARLTMRESKPYEKYVATETGLVGKDKRGIKQQFEDFRVYFADWKRARTLFAVCASWFLL